MMVRMAMIMMMVVMVMVMVVMVMLTMAIMVMTVMNRRCAQHLQRIKQFLAQKTQRPVAPREIYIGIFCNSGTHRSVAFTQLLSSSLSCFIRIFRK